MERSADQTVQPEGVTDSSVPDIDLEVPLPIPGEGADLSLSIASNPEDPTVSMDLMVREILEDYGLGDLFCRIRHGLLGVIEIGGTVPANGAHLTAMRSGSVYLKLQRSSHSSRGV